MIEPISSADDFATRLETVLRDRGLQKILGEERVTFPRFRDDTYHLGPLVDFAKNFRHDDIEIGTPSICAWDKPSHPMFTNTTNIVEVGACDLVDPIILDKRDKCIYEVKHDVSETDRFLISKSSEWFLAGFLIMASVPFRDVSTALSPLERKQLEDTLHHMNGTDGKFFILDPF